MTKIFNPKKADYDGMQLWLNPVDKTVYASPNAPTYGFAESGAFPIYDFNAHSQGIKTAKDTFGADSYVHDAFVDADFKALAEDYVSDIKAGGRQRMAALRSSTNSAVDIVNVWETVLGKKDRKYAGKNLAKEIAVPNLLISIDKASKFTGMTRMDEGQLSQLKELSYTRQNFEAEKYGLKFVIHEEARLKNVHNVLQDSIQVASNKVEQRQSFDVVSIANGSLTGQAAIGVWDTYAASGNSSFNPLYDLGTAQLNIEGSGVGGMMNRIGMHPLDYARYMSNTFIRGVASTSHSEVNFEPGTRELPAFPNAGLVVDQSIQQGTIACVDVESESTIALFQGPQRIGSAHDEETGDDKYFIIDYHLAALVNSETGIQITGATTPTAI